MSYVPPAIGSSGLTIPQYTDVRDNLVASFLSIFGSASYLGNDSLDYQDIAVRAKAISDVLQALQAVYLSYNPQTAIGTNLDLIGRLIGTPRKGASFSTVVLTLSGTAGSVITNGIAKDISGQFWDLPSSVVIGGGGTATATATAQNIGNVTANIGDVQIIATPTLGWTSVTNAVPAVVGLPVEPDSTYRARLLISQAEPSLTLLAGSVAGVAAVPGVTRSVVYENPQGFTASSGLCSTSGTSVTGLTGYPTDSSDDAQSITISGVSYTISAASGSSLTLTSSAGTQTLVPYSIGSAGTLGPAHSITAVVEGGASSAVAQAIYNNRGIGCLTNGTTSVTVTDPLNPAITMVISFYVVAYLPIWVQILVHPLPGFTSATQAAIAQDVVNYLNSLSIGENVVFSEVYGSCLNARPNPTVPLFSIRGFGVSAMVVETTGTLNGTTAVTLASGTSTANGQIVSGNGIVPGTTVASGGGTTSIVLSAAATITASGVPLQFFTPLGVIDISMPFNSAAQGTLLNTLVSTT